MRRAALLALLLTAAVAPAAVAQVPLTRVTTGPGETGDRRTEVFAVSADGARTLFGTHEPLSPDDRWPLWDFYTREGDALRVLSPFTGTGEKQEFVPSDVSDDARTVLFRTSAHWTADDRDGSESDLFVARDGVVDRIAVDQREFEAEPVGLSADGRRAIFLTGANLADDTDFAALDAFLWEAGRITRLSSGAGGGNDDRWSTGLTVPGFSRDASRVVLQTPEPLAAGDADGGWMDLYLREGTTTRWLTPGGGAHHATFDAISDDGSVVVLHTTERLLATDTDDRSDAYRVAGGVLQHVSPGNDPDANVGFESNRIGGDVLYLTPDGSRVLYTTYERVTADDTDAQLDTYLWQDGRVTKVCPGNGEFDALGLNLSCLVLGGADDLSSMVVWSRERLTGDDTDTSPDLFEVRGGTVTRVTTGPRGGNDDVDRWCPLEEVCMDLPFVSVDGGRIVFTTEERLVDADTDALTDVYLRAAGTTYLLSPHRGTIEDEVLFADGARDGSALVLETREQLTEDDRNARPDGFRLLPPAGSPPAAGGAGTAGSTTTTPAAAAAATATAGATGASTRPAAARSGPRLRVLPGRRTLRLTRRAPRIVARGTGLRFTLDRAATVTVLVERLLPGRRSGPRCVAPSRRLRAAPRCERRLPVAAPLRARLAAGTHVLQVGGRRARAGRHAVTLTPAGGEPARVAVRYARSR